MIFGMLNPEKIWRENVTGLWLHLTGEVDKAVSCPCEIFWGFNEPEIIKIGYCVTELFKN